MHRQCSLCEYLCVVLAVACPLFSSGANVPEGCVCNSGYSGVVTATSTHPFYVSTCQGKTAVRDFSLSLVVSHACAYVYACVQTSTVPRTPTATMWAQAVSATLGTAAPSRILPFLLSILVHAQVSPTVREYAHGQTAPDYIGQDQICNGIISKSTHFELHHLCHMCVSRGMSFVRPWR
jgi:hypothetical protein